MHTWIALLRGINVGGSHKLPMAALVAILEGIGATGVRTYVQSGNAVFRSEAGDPAALEAGIADGIEAGHGFRPRVLVLPVAALEQAAAANPYPEAEAAPTSLHLYFLAEAPASPDTAGLAAVQKDTESTHLGDRVFYLHAPEGIGRSKLAERVERLLGVPATARNWRTVTQVLALAREVAG